MLSCDSISSRELLLSCHLKNMVCFCLLCFVCTDHERKICCMLSVYVNLEFLANFAAIPRNIFGWLQSKRSKNDKDSKWADVMYKNSLIKLASSNWTSLSKHISITGFYWIFNRDGFSIETNSRDVTIQIQLKWWHIYFIHWNSLESKT